jgi:CRP-like cAMP-binding protein
MNNSSGHRTGVDQAQAVEKGDAFSRAEMFSGLETETLRSLMDRFKRATFDADEPLFLEGEPAQAFHLVARGKIKVVQSSPDGQEVLLHVFERGGIIGALPTIDEGTYPASAISLEPAVTYFVTAADFSDFMLDHPSITRSLLRFATRMLQSSHRRLRELATERVERRVARSLARLASQLGVEQDDEIVIQAPLSRQDLADMSGTTLFTISRTLKEWQRQGIVRAGRKKVVILQPHRLIEIAEDLPQSHSDAPPAGNG